MKKILIFSDTHDMIRETLDVIEKTPGVNMIIHAGDNIRDAEEIERTFPNIPLVYVKGNNDWFSQVKTDARTVVDGVKIFITHGHDYGVKYEKTLATLKSAAEDADLVVFGHTHKPYLEYGKVTLVNPGSITFGRTYAVCEINDKKVSVRIEEVK